MIYDLTGRQENIFSNATVLGFEPGTNTLLSWHHQEDKKGLYASFVVPAAAFNSRRSYVDFSPKHSSQSGTDTFIAGNKPAEKEGEYIFQVYDTQSQAFMGGDGNDRFEFHLSERTRTLIFDGDHDAKTIILDGAGGNDHVAFLLQQSEEKQEGVSAYLAHNRPTFPSYPYRLLYLQNGDRVRLQLVGIEHVTGTSGDDTLESGIEDNVTLNGDGGEDNLIGNNGDDKLSIERGFATGGAGRDSYVLLKSEQKGLLTIQENPAGEESTISLPGALSQIQQIYQEGEDLCLDLDNGNSTTRTVKLEGFYRQILPAENASRYAIPSNDGFSFQLVAGTKVRGTRIKKESEFLKSNRFEKIMILMNKYNGDVEQDDVATMLSTLSDIELSCFFEKLNFLPESYQERVNEIRRQPRQELISVRYHLQNDKTLNGAKVVQATYSLEGGNQSRLHVSSQDAHSGELAAYVLPDCFKLELSDLSDKKVHLLGDNEDNVLVAAAGFGSLMRGDPGADTYIVRPSEQSGELYIDNVDRSDYPAKDLLILPWRFDEIAWSDKMNGVVASHHSRSPLSDSVVTQSVDMTLSMNEEEPSHLSVRDITGETRRFFRSQSKGTYLSDTPVFMKDKAQLELTYASGSLVLDGRNRRLTEENDQPTVIVDKSQAGNEFHGTKNLQNLMIATGGNNTFYLGDKGDEVHGGAQEDKFYSGKGNDVIYGEGGDDSYYFGKEHGEDIIMDSAGQLSLDFTAEGLGEDDVTLSVNGNDLEIRAKGNEDSNVVRIKEWEGRIGYITLDNRVRLAGDNINALINEMSALPSTELSPPFSARLEAVVQRYWISVPQ